MNIRAEIRKTKRQLHDRLDEVGAWAKKLSGIEENEGKISFASFKMITDNAMIVGKVQFPTLIDPFNKCVANMYKTGCDKAIDEDVDLVSLEHIDEMISDIKKALK